MIKAIVEEQAPKTHEFIKYVLGKFVEHFPLSEKEVIEFEIYEHRDPFPKIKEISESYPVEKVIPESADAVKAHIAERGRAMGDWLPKRFAGLCTISSSDGWHGEKLRANVKFFVISPEKIYRECRKYGVLIPNEDEILASIEPNIARFDEDKSQIIWRGSVIAIEHDSNQYDVCKYAFTQAVNKNISWGDIVENVDEMTDYERDRARNSIYDAVYKINEKTKDLCGKPLFEWESKSFRRLA